MTKDEEDRFKVAWDFLDKPMAINLNHMWLPEEDWLEIAQYAKEAQITNDLLKLAQEAGKDTK